MAQGARPGHRPPCVIGDHDRSCLPLSRPQCLEIGSVVGAHDNSLTVEHTAMNWKRRDRLADAVEVIGILGRGASPEADALTIFAERTP